MGRSLGEMNSGAEKAKGVTGYEGIIPAPAEGKTSKGPSKEEVLQRFVDETPTEGSRGRGFATEVAPTRKSTIPTARPGSVAEGQRRASTNEVKTPFLDMHKGYSDIINTARNVRKNPLTPDHHDALDMASAHLMNSIVSYHKARTEGGLGTNNMNNDVAHGHLQDAVKHLTYAHETLVQSGVHDALRGRRLPHSLPKDTAVADLAARSTTLERKGVGGVAGVKKPYKRGVLGRNSEVGFANNTYTIKHNGDTVEFKSSDLSHLATTFGRNHPAIQKLNAMIGTERSKSVRISPEERREGVVKSTGAGVGSGNMANPKRRASSRRIDTSYRTDANPSNNTGGRPKF